jgi:hypothetical protein
MVLQKFVVMEKNGVSHLELILFNMSFMKFLFACFLKLVLKSCDKVVFLHFH